MTYSSKFVILGRRAFQWPGGRTVRGAFDTKTASLHLLPEQVAQLLEHPRDELTRPQVAALTRAGLLTDSDTAEVYLQDLEKASGDLSVRTFILMPTPACNMGCDYCGQDHSGHSLKVGYEDLVVPRIMASIEDPGVQVVNVDWFGGEPLLAHSTLMSISRRLIAHARRHGVEYQSQLTTNGSRFNPSLLRQLVVEAGITRIDVTVDGPRRVHDASRKMKNGSSTYDRILDSLQSAVGQSWADRCMFVVRSNVTTQTLPYVAEYLHDLARRGLTGSQGPALQIAPVHEWGTGTDAYSLSVSAFAAAEIEWFNLAVDLDLNFLPLPDLAGEPCSAGHQGTETIDPQGIVYDCPELALRPREPVFIPLGRQPPQDARPRADGALMKEMTWSTTSQSPPCRSCSLLPVCGGACALSRGQGRAQCPSMKHNFPERVDAAVRRALAAAEQSG